ncbi:MULTISPECIES: hypothetical protein [Burkholderia]|uniref:acyl-CoA dehydrogenase family protein n=1 Tax=Burkholderia TaxID=32008 RepID=UPI00119B84A4|nr:MULTISPECIES: hypothetical protein [Burkholderia]MDN7738105.1 hypothetical protein [Burkholderia gladioli]TWC75717.1 acyl-CoA oxidase [Burkholderia sp. SJZ089]TWD05230.1 acyl-CoA oxidase [Burkholderia sp. SJZ115]TWD05492.1 acyl-CoA oxidase [Burkholderia sp. SJZ091]
MLRKLVRGHEARHERELVALLEQPAFAAIDDEPHRGKQQHGIYRQLELLNGWARSGSALIADNQRLFDALAFAATVSPPLFSVAQEHYGVCLASIRTLGRPSAALDRVITDLDKLSSVAVILNTEIGVSCSHFAIGTRADYDPASDEFVLTTPTASACKFLGNVALDGVAKTGLVFAQVWCGDRHLGLFPFVVPIRDRERVCEGVNIKELSGASSLGLDYSVVSFSGARVPRTHWLQDSATLGTDGEFHDPLGDAGKRMLRSLSAGTNAWIASAVGSAAAARASAWTAIRYASKRKTSALLDRDGSILAFRNVQGMLLTALAEAFVISHFASRLTGGVKHEGTTSGISTVPWAAVSKIGALTKAITVAGAADAIHNCRRATGGHGFVGENRLCSYKDLVDAYGSAGGDSQLILIEIGRELASKPSELPEVPALPESLDGVDALHALMRFEERSQHQRASAGLAAAKPGDDAYLSIWNPRLPALIDLARAHGCRLAVESFLAQEVASEDRQPILALATLYVLEHFGQRLAHELRDAALAGAFDVVMANLDRLLDAFDLSTALVNTPLAQDDYIAAYIADLPLGG